jgi:hypothetical protein
MFSLFLMACQGEEASEYYGNLLNSPGGLTLVQDEHEFGWERGDCYSCHTQENIHRDREDRESGIDMTIVQEFVADGGEESCVQCHGENGQ